VPLTKRVNEAQPLLTFSGTENYLLLLGTETGRGLVTILTTSTFAKEYQTTRCFAGNLREGTTRLIKNCSIRNKILFIIRCG